MTAVPVTVGRLFDGSQLVRKIHLGREGAPEIIQTNDSPPARLRELDASLHEDDANRLVPFSIWEHTGWGSTDYIEYREWMQDLGPRHPPAEAIVARQGKPPVVVVRYTDYQRKGSKLG